VAQALAALHGHEWVGEIGKGLTTVTVKVRQPEVAHVVKMQDFEKWLNHPERTPAEVMLKKGCAKSFACACRALAFARNAGGSGGELEIRIRRCVES
jgi:hypothetical protein